jgi:hypothetical protein
MGKAWGNEGILVKKLQKLKLKILKKIHLGAFVYIA